MVKPDASSGEVLIRAEGVSKKFSRSLKRSMWYGLTDIAADLNPFRPAAPVNGGLRAGEFWSVKDVSFELRRGDCLGLIGRNGAGKTTLLKMLNGLIRPDRGRIEMRGRVGALIALGAGFNPILTGRENIHVNASVLGLSKREIDDKIEEIIDFAEIRDFIDTPVQNYSSGMQVRLGFAVATALKPDILLLDEVLAVGDVAFRAKCFQRIGAILDHSAVIFVSHDAVQVSRICDQALYLRQGECLAYGPTQDVMDRYEADQPAVEDSSSTVRGESVVAFRCTPEASRLNWGESATITLELALRGEQSTGLALLALRDGDASVAQADVTAELNAALRAGTAARLRLGPLNLRSGTYRLVVTILNTSRKGTLIHALDAMRVDISGPRGYGVAYQVPTQALEPTRPTSTA